MEKRLIELANIAYNRNIPVYTDFLNLNEQNVYYNISKNLMPPIGAKPMGGYNLAERKIIAFYPYEMEEYLEYPYTVISIRPLNSRFAEELTHRDFLGAEPVSSLKSSIKNYLYHLNKPYITMYHLISNNHFYHLCCLYKKIYAYNSKPCKMC